MSRRCVTRSMAVALAIWWLAPAPLTGQEARPASGSATVRTPWGDPDLQGIWSYATITPLERPATLAEREFLTAEEVSEQNQREAGRASSERRAELTPDRDLALAYNQVWWDRGMSTGRTSLIVDPPNGRLPPLTPEAQRRQAAQRVNRRAHPYNSWEDRPLQERCMTYQRVPPVPSGCNNTYHILQTPGHVAIFNEMIHDVRFVPLDGRAPIDDGIRQWNGDSRGRWEGGRHPCRRDHELPRRDHVAGISWDPGAAGGRAVYAHRRRHHRLPALRSTTTPRTSSPSPLSYL